MTRPEAIEAAARAIDTAYKLGQFLNEALPDAWPLAERVPDAPARSVGVEKGNKA